MLFNKKSTQLNATAVFPLNDSNLELLRKMQVRFIDNIPKGAKFLAFLEDGDACFLESIDNGDRFSINIPHFAAVSFYQNITVEI